MKATIALGSLAALVLSVGLVMAEEFKMPIKWESADRWAPTDVAMGYFDRVDP